MTRRRCLTNIVRSFELDDRVCRSLDGIRRALHTQHSVFMNAADSLQISRRQVIDLVDEVGEITVLNREWAINVFARISHNLYLEVCQHACKV